MDNSKCIPDVNILDSSDWYSSIQCPDESDEIPDYHLGRTCPDGYFKCDSNEQCIEMENVCDGGANIGAQCRDGSDERDFCFNWDCHKDYWKCADTPICLYTGEPVRGYRNRMSSVCNGYKDCLVCSEDGNCTDISDEANTLCICGEDEWPCQDTDGCVKNLQVCDGIKNCNDESDETVDFCTEWECLPGYGKCQDVPKCVAWCDGPSQCSNGFDEQNCEAYNCVAGKQKCADNKQCINEQNICDEQTHCLDGSDELCTAPCLQSPIDGKSIVKRCFEAITKCFPFSQFCDRVADCPLGSDEADSGCTCQDWNLQECRIDNRDLCIYPEWLNSENGDNLPCERETRRKRSVLESITTKLRYYPG